MWWRKKNVGIVGSSRAWTLGWDEKKMNRIGAFKDENKVCKILFRNIEILSWPKPSEVSKEAVHVISRVTSANSGTFI